MPAAGDLAEQIERVFHRYLPSGWSLSPRTNFFEGGFTSVRLAGVLTELSETGVPMSLVDFFRYPTLDEFIVEMTARSGSRRGQH